jgi:MinD superfamily P-loop ATPase
LKEVVVISGKGGTGKTSILASFAYLAGGSVITDCDVDAADLHLVLSPEKIEEHPFSGGVVAEIDRSICSGCGKCLELCRYGAVEAAVFEKAGPGSDKPPRGVSASSKIYSIDEIACEGCGVCAYFCPEGAIRLPEADNGRWFVSQTRFGKLVHAKLNPGSENSGKLVTIVRNRARKIAEEEKADLILTDGSPGVGCPVIASLTGARLALVVSEPTQSGVHDLERVVGLTGHFGIDTMIAVNKSDINGAMTDRIIDFAESRSIPVAGDVVYSPDVTRAQIEGVSVVEYSGGRCSDDIRNIWDKVTERMELEEK